MTNLPAERLMSRTARFRSLLGERWLGQRRRGHVVDFVGPVVLVRRVPSSAALLGASGLSSTA